MGADSLPCQRGKLRETFFWLMCFDLYEQNQDHTILLFKRKALSCGFVLGFGLVWVFLVSF